MAGIPPTLNQRLEDVLLKCGPFDNIDELKAVFADSRINFWQKEVRDASTSVARVQINVDFLRKQSNVSHENGLILFLHVLSDLKDTEDACHAELETIADNLDEWMNRTAISRPEQRPTDFVRLLLTASGGILFLAIAFFLYGYFFGNDQRSEATANPSSPSVNLCPEAVYGVTDDFDGQIIVVQGTEFLMGDENPATRKHKVVVQTFAIDKYEVTNDQYMRYFKERAGQVSPPGLWIGENYPSGTAFHPVVGVTWKDARDYCEWAGKRLPTEAEWELACRGMENLLYPWGNEPQPGLANVAENHCVGTVAVGGYDAQDDSTVYVSDILGNVAEWTSSAAMNYPYRADDGREDDTNGDTERIIRGGSFQLPLLKCVTRMVPAVPASADVGFRCARDVLATP